MYYRSCISWTGTEIWLSCLSFLTVMRNLNCNQSNWEIEKLNSDLKVHSLEQDLENLKQECSSLRKELQKYKQKVPSFLRIFFVLIDLALLEHYLTTLSKQNEGWRNWYQKIIGCKMIVIKLTLNIAIGWFTSGNSACT